MISNDTYRIVRLHIYIMIHMMNNSWCWISATKTQLIRLPCGSAPHMSSNGKYQLINSQKVT